MPTCDWLVISPMMDIMFKHYTSKNYITLNRGVGNKYECLVPKYHYSVLDVGIGNGKYGMLIREYMDACWLGRRYEDKSTWKIRMIGVEPFARYVTDVHRYHYDEILNCSILDVVRNPLYDREKFDLILLSDIIEHLTKDEGVKLFADMKKWMKPDSIILISTPNVYFHQQVVDGCEWEEHKCQWSLKDFEAIPDYRCQALPVIKTTLVLTMRLK